MTSIVSAAFGHSSNAKLAEITLKEHGYRVSLTHQAPTSGLSGHCPGNDYSPAARTLMKPDRECSILTVLVTDETRTFALDTIRLHSGRQIG